MKTLKTLTIFVMCVLGFGTQVSAQNIFTVCGNGVDGDPVSGSMATATALQPQAIAADDIGNYYVVDQNGMTYKIDRSGIITWIGGTGTDGFSGDGGPATAAAFYVPQNIAADKMGNVYLADMLNQRIRKISTDGIVTTIAGNGTAGFSGDGGQATNAEINWPWGVAVDTAGNVYICDHMNFRLRKVNSAGIISTIAGNSVTGETGDGGPATAAQVAGAIGIISDLHGNIYFIDGNETIRKINQAGIISTVAGSGAFNFSGDGGPATAAGMMPIGIAVDQIGNLYIADQFNERVYQVDSSGNIHAYAGNGYRLRTAGTGYVGAFSGDGGAAIDAELNGPSSVAIDVNGNLLISDQFNFRIRKTSGPASLNIDQVTAAPGGLNIYPNPNRGSFIVTLPYFRSPATITITDITGKVIETRKVAKALGNTEYFTIHNTEPATYIVKLEAADQVLFGKVASW